MSAAASPPAAATRADARFPIGLCIAGILCTSLGLVAAVLGAQWTTAPSSNDMLHKSWMFVNVMWVFAWMVLWPAGVAGRGGASCPCSDSRLRWDLAALSIGALPAISVAALLSNASPVMILAMLLLQASIALFAMALLSTARHNRRAAWLVALPPILAAAGPLAAYIWIEFFPHAPHGWITLIPTITAASTAAPFTQWQSAPPGFWLIVSIYSLTACPLLILSKILSARLASPPRPT